MIETSKPSTSRANGAHDPLFDAMILWRDRCDQSAAVSLVSQLSPLMLGIALRSLPQPCMAEDAVQTAWLKLIRSFVRFDGSIPLSAWAVVVIKSVCANMRRTMQRRPTESMMETESGSDAPQETARPPDERLIAGEDLRCVLRAVEAMPEPDRLIFDRLLLNDEPGAEVARLTGLSAGAVRVRACRIRSSLRHLFDESSRPASTQQQLSRP